MIITYFRKPIYNILENQKIWAMAHFPVAFGTVARRKTTKQKMGIEAIVSLVTVLK